MKDNIELVWEATSRLTENFINWNLKKRMEYKSSVFVTLYICIALLRKIVLEQDLTIELKFFYKDFEELGENRVRFFLDQVNADDKEILNLVDRLYNHTNTRLKEHQPNFRWEQMGILINELKSQDFEKTSKVIVSEISIELIKKSIAYPNPQVWSSFIDCVNSRINFNIDENFPPPFVLTAWNEIPDHEKFERFHDQLRIVADKGYIRQIKVILDNYSEDNWHYFG